MDAYLSDNIKDGLKIFFIECARSQNPITFKKSPQLSFWDRNLFHEVMHQYFDLTNDLLIERIFRVFDKDTDSVISVNEWIEGMKIFMNNELADKIKYCFQVYDLDGSGEIGREEVYQMLNNSLIKQQSEEDPDESIKDLVEITFKLVDVDRDNKISAQDFSKAVMKDNLLLESMGQCIPDSDIMSKFLQKISDLTKPCETAK